MSESCQRCRKESEDLRTLWMSCFYAMEELPIPFAMVETSALPRHFYTLRVCKDCRAEWMRAIQAWFEAPIIRESQGTGVFVREHGASVELTEEQVRERFPDGNYYRVKG